MTTSGTALSDDAAVTPDQQQSEVMRFAIGQSSLGLVLVARSVVGVTAVLLGDDAAALRSDLQKRFRAVTFIQDDPATEETTAEVIAFVEQPERGWDKQLDMRGSDLQCKVWQAMRGIPIGTTTSYTALARTVGRPRAVRAVARACAGNPIAVIVPCHRVVRLNGELSGYRWGVERKRALLAHEAAAAPTWSLTMVS